MNLSNYMRFETWDDEQLKYKLQQFERGMFPNIESIEEWACGPEGYTVVRIIEKHTY